MPKYDYKCNQCGNTEDRFVPMQARKEQYCECGDKLQLQLSAPTPLNANSGGRSGV